MTLNEATGIHRCNVDKTTGRELSHRERYTRYIDYLGGLDAVKPYIPFELDYLAPKYHEDPLLNNTSILIWDNAAGFRCFMFDAIPTYGGLWNLYCQHGIDTVSCATGVCILKEAARMLIERGEV
mgnify:FL=1|jgi:hypothetical protein